MRLTARKVVSTWDSFPGVEEALTDAIDYVIPVVEAIGAIVIVVGVLTAFAAWVLSELRVRPRRFEEIRLLLGRFLALGIEFQLGSDILSTAVAPSYEELGKLGAIVAIRTVLNFFLGRELEQERRREEGAETT